MKKKKIVRSVWSQILAMQLIVVLHCNCRKIVDLTHIKRFWIVAKIRRKKKVIECIVAGVNERLVVGMTRRARLSLQSRSFNSSPPPSEATIPSEWLTLNALSLHCGLVPSDVWWAGHTTKGYTQLRTRCPSRGGGRQNQHPASSTHDHRTPTWRWRWLHTTHRQDNHINR